jgi:hypothetical protein
MLHFAIKARLFLLVGIHKSHASLHKSMPISGQRVVMGKMCLPQHSTCDHESKISPASTMLTSKSPTTPPRLAKINSHCNELDFQIPSANLKLCHHQVLPTPSRYLRARPSPRPLFPLSQDSHHTTIPPILHLKHSRSPYCR